MLGINKKQTSPEQAKGGQPSLALQIANQYTVWIIALVALGVIFAGYVLVLDTQVSAVKSSAQESLPAKLKIRDDLKAIKSELDSAVLDYEKIKLSKKSVLDRLALLLPSESQYGDLFTMVDTVTQISGLKLTSMTVALADDTKPQQRAKAPSGDAADPVAAGLVKQLSIHITVEGGTYETFKKYLENLERNIRLFDIKSISFEGSAFIPSADGTLPTPQYDIELTTYYQP